MAQLDGMRVAFVVANEGVEDAELASPWDAIKEAGGEPVLVATSAGSVDTFRHLDRARSFPVDTTTRDVQAADVGGLVLPGGVANADQLRTDAEAVRLVADALDAGLPVAVICHGPWTIVEADRVKGRTLTSWPSLRTDVENAGGTWVDRDVEVCEAGPGPLVSSRKPDDLPAFNATMVERFARARAGARS